jgi:hypothetical protein
MSMESIVPGKEMIVLGAIAHRNGAADSTRGSGDGKYAANIT